MAIPVLWRTMKERYNLQSEVCPECERLVFPPRRLCPYCGKVNTAEAETEAYEFCFMLPHSVELSAAGDD